ncbi:MAG: phenylalanine--tRNA ligase subunit alpha [Planctomycetota bacterium]
MPPPDLLGRLAGLREEALSRISSANDLKQLDEIRVLYLGKKGSLKCILKSLGKAPAEERAALGTAANRLKEELQGALSASRETLGAAGPARRPAIDVTLPGRCPPVGSRHPVYQVGWKMIDIFHNLGFRVEDGPEVEDEWHNFIGLNIPPDHIARDPSENFYLQDELLLRSQTSTVQIRVMEARTPPLRIIAPGKVYRPDTVDASHSYMFHQLEGLMVDEGVSFRHLKTTLLLFFRQMFREDVRVRLRPSFFPFTEPSAEIDLSCPFCGGEGCKVCGRKGWMEMGGCGMVDPNVFEAVGYDPERYTGFAFGMGIDRIAMALHDIPDIRYLFENDVRFLSQFAF